MQYGCIEVSPSIPAQAAIDRILARFAAAGGELVADIVGAAGDPMRVADLAHKLKGAARAAGATRLGDHAAWLEQSADSAGIARLAAEWKRVIGELRSASST